MGREKNDGTLMSFIQTYKAKNPRGKPARKNRNNHTYSNVHKSGQGLKEERWWYRDKEIHGESSDLCAVQRQGWVASNPTEDVRLRCLGN